MITSIAEATENLAAAGWKLTVEYEKGWKTWRATASRPAGSVTTSAKTQDAALDALAKLWTDSVLMIAENLEDFRVATSINSQRVMTARVRVGNEVASDVPLESVSGCLLALRSRPQSARG